MANIVVIVENHTDCRTATKLAERVIIDKVDWLDEQIFEHCVAWQGLLPEPYLDDWTSCWKNLNEIVKQLKKEGITLPRRHGSQGKSDGAAAKKVLRIIQALQNHGRLTCDGILLIRDCDTDKKDERLVSLQKFRLEVENTHTIAIGVANRNREAWVLNGFIPDGDKENALIANVKKRNGFDPTIEAHRLQETAKEKSDRKYWRNPKNVLSYLTEEKSERERRCWEESDLQLLRDRGEKTGLTAYLDEVEQQLIPLVTPTRPE